MTGEFRCQSCGGKSLVIGKCSACADGALLGIAPPQASEEAWRALIWAFVRWITEGGPEPFAALQAAKRNLRQEVESERARG